MAIVQDTKYAVIVLLMVLACVRSLAWENLARIIPTAGHVNTAVVLTTRSASARGQGSHVSQTTSARCKDVGVTINNVKISGELQSEFLYLLL